MSEQQTAMTVDGLSFEEALAELEATVQRLEEGNLPLSDAISLYERGMTLAHCCADLLDRAELQVEQLAVPPFPQTEGEPF